MTEKDLHIRWPHRWRHQKTKVISSKINGLGVATTKPIKAGEVVCVFGGIVVPLREIKQYRAKVGHIGFQVDDEFFLVPHSREDITITGAYNHSCDPNIGFDGTIKIIAIKDIKTGEELSLDYAFMESFFEPFECECNSQNCRKIITPDDWKKPELQRKYGEYFSPYLK